MCVCARAGVCVCVCVCGCVKGDWGWDNSVRVHIQCSQPCTRRHVLMTAASDIKIQREREGGLGGGRGTEREQKVPPSRTLLGGESAHPHAHA